MFTFSTGSLRHLLDVQTQTHRYHSVADEMTSVLLSHDPCKCCWRLGLVLLGLHSIPLLFPLLIFLELTRLLR